MPIDRRYCFDCDEHLGEPPADDPGIRWCRRCEADLDAYRMALGDFGTMPAPSFVGTIALGVPLPGWPTEVVLLSLEHWGHFAELTVHEMPGKNPPEPHPRAAAMSSPLGEQPPRKWTITTESGSVHHGGAGGGGTRGTGRLLSWHTTIAPPPPKGARRLMFHAQSPGSQAQTAVHLAAHSMSRRTATASRSVDDDIDRTCPSCGPPLPPEPEPEPTSGIDLDWAIPIPPNPSPPPWDVDDPRPICATCRSTQDTVIGRKRPSSPMPDRLMALGVELDPIFGTKPVITTLACWPDYFELTIAGETDTAWGSVLSSKRARRWSATDDIGNRYLGSAPSGSSGLGLTHTHLTFVPTLAPNANTLTITFPASIDGQGAQATIELDQSG